MFALFLNCYAKTLTITTYLHTYLYFMNYKALMRTYFS